MTEQLDLYDDADQGGAGPIGEMAAARNGGHWGVNNDGAGYARQAIEAFMTPGDDVFRSMLRGVLDADQVAPGARMLEEAMWLQYESDPSSLPEGARELMRLPYGARKVIVVGMLNASVEGRARRETAQVLTHGQAMLPSPVGAVKRAGGAVGRFLGGRRKGRLAA